MRAFEANHGQHEFNFVICCFILLSLQLAAPLDTLGKAATEVEMRKPTHIGLHLLLPLQKLYMFLVLLNNSFRCVQKVCEVDV